MRMPWLMEAPPPDPPAALDVCHLDYLPLSSEFLSRTSDPSPVLASPSSRAPSVE